MTISELKQLKESEDKVEFKMAENRYNYNNGRRSVLGYVVALANEGGGKLILGVKENKNGLNIITGSKAWEGQEGKLKEDIFRDKQIRVETEVLHEGINRVLVIHIPKRPVGKTLKFEDVPLMRVGEDLLPMSDEQLFKILQEQEPDFSAKPCSGLTIDDIDEHAIEILKDKYSKKQNNPSFKTCSTARILSDLDLISGAQPNYAALILLGKPEKIKQFLPQAKVVIEYRRSETAIPSDNRTEIQDPLFVAIEKIWDYLNQPASNPTHKIRQGPYIFDVPYFNEDVVREAVLNAIVHRDYSLSSEVFIKQYPSKLIITNPGGFPKGVNIDNLLTINSTPRSRLLADVLLKTGLVERSGQGVDKLFLYSLIDSKPAPDYSRSSLLQVELKISMQIQDTSFLIFANEEQNKRDENNKMGVFDLITLDKIRIGVSTGLDFIIVQKFLHEGLIKRSGKTTSEIYTLGDKYYEVAQVEDDIEGYRPIYLRKIAEAFNSKDFLSMADFSILFEDMLKRTQVKYMVEKLVKNGILYPEGETKGTKYKLSLSTTSNNLLSEYFRKLIKK
jgi:ATP-dependent DNA helicase RecG